MPDLLLELFSEEIPARMQARAAEDLRKLVADALVEQGLVYESARAFATPRRLALNVTGLPARSPDTREERKGPRVGAPDAALAGFLKAAGLASIDEATIQTDPKKGDFYVAVTARPGRDAKDVIAEIVPDVIRRFPWPKSMRWGSGSLRWVRPLQSILCVFGPETEETEVVDFEVDGLKSGRTTFGHRFMAPGEITVRRFDDYVEKLERAFVVLDPDRRKEIIRTDARTLAFAQGFDLVADEALVDEVAGLVEWPVVLMGAFDPDFLRIPPEVIRLTIRANQKCFVVREAGASHPPLQGEGRAEGPGWGRSAEAARTPSRPAAPTDLPPAGGGGALAPRFLLVSNLIAGDGGEKIVAGNGRVIAARLSDARFFYETDLKTKLEVHAEKLKSIVFHEKLGTQAERVERIARLARELAPLVGADPEKADRAARLAKADLVTEMVGEFPELQGVMGRYYALAQGEDADVADAIRDHYRPAGAGDQVPTAPVSIAVALADRLDTLVGFWAIDEKPTGSKDPYALRRAALGVIRIVLGNGVRVSLAIAIDIAARLHRDSQMASSNAFADEAKVVWRQDHHDEPVLLWPHAEQLFERPDARETREFLRGQVPARHDLYLTDFVQRGDGEYLVSDGLLVLPKPPHWRGYRPDDLLAFFADRLKVQLRDEGARHDLVDAVFALGADASHPPLQGEGRAEGPGRGPSAEAARTPSRPATPTDLPPAGGGGVQDDLLMIVRRVEALAAFLATEDGASLLTAYRRAANILAIEEKKDGRAYSGHADPAAFALEEERVLFDRIAEVAAESDSALSREDFAAAMAALARLRAPVDSFFDTVTVNAEDPALRENRLRLLSQIRSAMDQVAVFSRIAG